MADMLQWQSARHKSSIGNRLQRAAKLPKWQSWFVRYLLGYGLGDPDPELPSYSDPELSSYGILYKKNSEHYYYSNQILNSHPMLPSYYVFIAPYSRISRWIYPFFAPFFLSPRIPVLTAPNYRMGTFQWAGGREHLKLPSYFVFVIPCSRISG